MIEKEEERILQGAEVFLAEPTEEAREVILIQEKDKSCIDGEWEHEIDLDTIDNYENKQIESAMNEKYSLGPVEENTAGSKPLFIPNEKSE